jgi:hypothetical protein
MKPGGDASVALVRADVLVLLREKRYEEALARLYRARSETPGSAELQKSIDQVKEFLIGAYAKRLGGLDQIARPVPPAAGRSPDVVLLSRYIDGGSSYGDLAQICPLGQLRTLQVLVEMYAQKPAPVGLLGIEPEVPYSGPRTLDEPSVLLESDVPPPPDTARSPASLPAASPAPESPEAKQYREGFAQGTAAFIQRRFEDAQRAFEDCAALRPGDGPADVMLRRVRRELASR